MIDIRNVTNKPTIVCSFRAPLDHPELVAYWVNVNARGKMLSSDGMPFASSAWSPEVYAKLSDLSVAHRSAASLSSKLWAAPPAIPTDEMKRRYPKFAGHSSFELLKASIAASKLFMATADPALAETRRLSDELASLSSAMATRSFMEQLATEAIPLKVEPGDSDERSYALYRSSVWSCIRDLETGQWKLLIDRVIKSGEAELAAALAEEAGTSQTRERLSPEVRRSVWVRDQGKCARCGNRERLEFDHIVPVSRGGSNTERNIELLCELCNRAKSDSIM